MINIGCVLCHLALRKAELPPPYTAIASSDAGGVPVINCRVCQSLINLDGKLHQHVVKCTVCNEATVSLVSEGRENFLALSELSVEAEARTSSRDDAVSAG